MKIVFIEKDSLVEEIISIGPTTDLIFYKDKLNIYNSNKHFSSFEYDKYLAGPFLSNDTQPLSYAENYIFNKIKSRFDKWCENGDIVLKDLGLLGEI